MGAHKSCGRWVVVVLRNFSRCCSVFIWHDGFPEASIGGSGGLQAAPSVALHSVEVAGQGFSEGPRLWPPCFE